MEQPIESNYKDWTDYAEAMLAYKDWEAEELREKVDFLDGGYTHRNRRATKMMNEGISPTAWQLSHCSLNYLVDTIIDLLNKKKALTELKAAAQKKTVSWAETYSHLQEKYEKLLTKYEEQENEIPLPPPPGPEM